MIVSECAFDPVRDLRPVDQFGFVDLKVALDSSMVPSQMPGSDSDYNGIEDPEQVLGTPRDIFEAIDAQKAAESIASSSAPEDGDPASEV